MKKKQKNKNVGITFSGLKCDFCDWTDKTIPVEDFEMYLNKPCPKCGHNLLTEHDYKIVKRILWITKIINLLPLKKSDTIVKTTLDFNGVDSPIIKNVETIRK